MSELCSVTVSGTAGGSWVVSIGRTQLATFGGCSGSEARARKYAAEVRREVEAGTYDPHAARGVCSFGNPCDRGRVNVPLRELTADLLGRVRLCPEHLWEARPGPGRKRLKGASSVSVGAEVPTETPGLSSPGRRRRKAASP